VSAGLRHIDSYQNAVRNFFGRRPPVLTFIKTLPATTPDNESGDNESGNKRENIMPIETVLVTVAVVAVFTGFALVLAWAEHQTRNL
jgi:hypothetical protein